MPYKEVNRAAYVLSHEISSVDLIMNCGEARVDLGSMVGLSCNLYRGFTALFVEKTYLRILKSSYFNCASVSCIYGGRFTAGDDTVRLIHEDPALAVLPSDKSIGRAAVLYFCLSAAKYGGAKWEFKHRIGCCI